MKFKIDPSLLGNFPSLSVFAFRAKRVAQALNKIDLKSLAVESKKSVKLEYANTDILAASRLVTEWREVYRQQDLKPSQFRSSIEALIRRVISNKPILVNVPLVDFYNLHSIRYQACLGGYDMKKLPGNEIVLRLCDFEFDRFTPLGGTSEAFPLNQNLGVYAIGAEILCWGFNCRDSAITALDKVTDDVMFLAEAITDEQKERAFSALNAMSESLANEGAEVSEISSTDAVNPCTEIVL